MMSRFTEALARRRHGQAAKDRELLDAVKAARKGLQDVRGGIQLLAERGPEIPIQQRLAFAEQAGGAVGAMLTLLDRIEAEVREG